MENKVKQNVQYVIKHSKTAKWELGMIDYLEEILIFFLSASFASLWADSAFL